jgi:hypothetical protein
MEYTASKRRGASVQPFSGPSFSFSFSFPPLSFSFGARLALNNMGLKYAPVALATTPLVHSERRDPSLENPSSPFPGMYYECVGQMISKVSPHVVYLDGGAVRVVTGPML